MLVSLISPMSSLQSNYYCGFQSFTKNPVFKACRNLALWPMLYEEMKQVFSNSELKCLLLSFPQPEDTALSPICFGFFSVLHIYMWNLEKIDLAATFNLCHRGGGRSAENNNPWDSVKVIVAAVTEELSSYIISWRKTSINSEWSWFLEFSSKEARRVSTWMKHNCFTVLII